MSDNNSNNKNQSETNIKNEIKKVDMRKFSENERDKIRGDWIIYCQSKDWNVSEIKILKFSLKKKVTYNWLVDIINLYGPLNNYKGEQSPGRPKK